MLALIFKKKNFAMLALALFALGSFASCATEKPPPRLVDDPNDRHESVLPWNQQEKWEQSANLPEVLSEQQHR